MTAHFAGQGTQPSSHPGLDRKTVSLFTFVTPTLAKAGSILIGITKNGGAILPLFGGL